MNITKSAPLPERPCEQLTCCTKNEYEQGDYINRVAKRHNCRIAGKKIRWDMTPMTLCLTEGHSGSFRSDSFFLCSLRNVSRAKAHGVNLSDSCSCPLFLRRLFRSSDDVLVNSLSFIVLSCNAVRRSTPHHGAGGDYSDSLALRRWRRLISPRMAVTINCASVSFSSLTKFISLKTSRGTLAVFCCDLLLVVPVGITGLLTVRWRSVYAEKKIKKA